MVSRFLCLIPIRLPFGMWLLVQLAGGGSVVALYVSC